MWGIYTVDSDTRRSPSFRDSLSFGGGSLENVRMLGVNVRASSRTSSQREPYEQPRLFDDLSTGKLDTEPRKQLRLDNGLDDRHGSRASSNLSGNNASTRHDSERRLIRGHQQQPQNNRQRRPENTNSHHEPDPEAEAAAIREKKRRKIVFVIILVAASLLLMSILLMVITVQLTPAINEKVRQQHEDLLRQQQHRTTNSSHIIANITTGSDMFSTINSTNVEQ